MKLLRFKFSGVWAIRP